MKLFAVFLVIAFYCGIALSGPTRQGAMSFVGKYGNKNYYFNSDLKNVIWMDARKICEDAGMKMGEYLTNAEYKFIQQNSAQRIYGLGVP